MSPPARSNEIEIRQTTAARTDQAAAVGVGAGVAAGEAAAAVFVASPAGDGAGVGVADSDAGGGPLRGGRWENEVEVGINDRQTKTKNRRNFCTGKAPLE